LGAAFLECQEKTMRRSVTDLNRLDGGVMNNICQNFIGGALVPATASHHTSVYNPSRGKVIAQVPLQRRAIRRSGCLSREERVPLMGRYPVVECARLMLRFTHLLEENFEELSRLVTREHGKTPEEAKGDVLRGSEVFVRSQRRA
jgi:malonate-semialdehyde dehydrogenase (acetylating)/methylmalonate-semialdehyde dehydrogenase